MRYVIGIDAGGTKTVGLLADESGRVSTKARMDGANLRVHGELGVEKVLYRVLMALDPPEPPAATCIGIAGVQRPEDEQVIREVLRRLGLRRAVRVVHDAVIALVAGAARRVGIVIVAGTGSIVYGEDEAGRRARSSGWGYLLGDEGSAFWLGQQALRRIVRASDGRGEATRLEELVQRRLGVDVPAGLVPWVHDPALVRYRMADLAPLVQEAADQGDEVAAALLDEAALELAQAASSVAGQLELPERYPVVLSGGAFRACPGLEPRLVQALDERAEVLRLQGEPAEGAVKLALEMLV